MVRIVHIMKQTNEVYGMTTFIAHLTKLFCRCPGVSSLRSGANGSSCSEDLAQPPHSLSQQRTSQGQRFPRSLPASSLFHERRDLPVPGSDPVLIRGQSNVFQPHALHWVHPADESTSIRSKRLLPDTSWYSSAFPRFPPACNDGPEFIASRGGASYGIGCNAANTEGDSKDTSKPFKPSIPSRRFYTTPHWRVPQADLKLDENVLTWNTEEVCDFVVAVTDSLEISQVFRERGIDGNSLVLLEEVHLVDRMSMKLGPALKILAQIHKLVEKMRDETAVWWI